MKVGGRNFDESKRGIELKMRGVEPETIQKYLVEVNGIAYPPKQVLAHVTGWERQSFTTMEAQRVLNKVGFVCREAGRLPAGRADWLLRPGEEPAPRAMTFEDRVNALEAAVVTNQEAIASLVVRIQTLERAAEPSVGRQPLS
jgi:hypothetical protein